MAYHARAYPSFCSIKRLGVFLLPLNGMLVHRRVTPQHLIRQYPFTHLGEERHRESKVSCPRTQHSARSGLDLNRSPFFTATEVQNPYHFTERFRQQLDHFWDMKTQLFYIRAVRITHQISNLFTTLKNT